MLFAWIEKHKEVNGSALHLDAQVVIIFISRQFYDSEQLTHKRDQWLSTTPFTSIDAWSYNSTM